MFALKFQLLCGSARCLLRCQLLCWRRILYLVIAGVGALLGCIYLLVDLQLIMVRGMALATGQYGD